MSVSSSSGPQARAAAAERDANRRIARAEQSVKETQAQVEARTEQMRDQFERQYANQSVRSAELLENERSKTYQAIGELKKNQNDQLKQSRKAGDDALEKTQAHYRGKVYKTERQGVEQLQELQSYQSRIEKAARQEGELAQNKIQTENEIQAARLRADGEQRAETLKTTYKAEVDRLQETTAAARQHAEARYNENYESTLTEGQKRIDELLDRTTGQLQQLRADTSAKLSAYANRARDPFYKIMDLSASLQDRGSQYVITARIPEHEQKHVSVSVKGDHVIISGYRSNQEKLDLGEGRTKSSAAHQTFTETLPLSHPVEPTQMTKEFRGDQLIVTVQKRPTYGAKPQHRKPALDKPRVSRPQFPENLGKVLADPEPPRDDEEMKDRISSRTRGSGTLSRG